MGNLITAKEPVRILDCSPDDILEWRKRGEIKGYVYKRRFWRFRRKDVERFGRENGGPFYRFNRSSGGSYHN